MSRHILLLCAILISLSSALAVTAADFIAPETDFSFVSDVEVTYRGRSAVARMFVDEKTKECRLVTSNLTSILLGRGMPKAQVQSCDSGAFTARLADVSALDEESRILARICGVLSWPSASAWSDKTWTEKQITRVPVFTNKDKKCALVTPSTTTAACDCVCEYAFDHNDWVGESRQALRAVTVTGCPATCGFPDAVVSIMSFWRVNIPPTMLLHSCQDTSTNFLDPRTRWGSLLDEVGFPALPNEFSALFKVTLLEYGVNVEFHETFSAPLRAARATVFTARETMAGDIATAETYLTHGTAGVTFRVQHDVMSGSMATLSGEGAYSCEQMIYKSDIFSSSVEALLMVPSTFPPVKLGTYTVRGVMCDLWGQSVSEDLRIEWYFPTADSITAATGNSQHERPAGAPSAPDKRLPRRIVLRGEGRSPFFTNHPFVPSSVTLPNGDTDFCDQVPFFYNPHCLSNDESGITTKDQFEHVIDIAELPSGAARNYSVFAPPSECIGSRLVRGTACDGVTPGVVVVLSLVCVAAGAVMALWCCAGNNGEPKDGLPPTTSGEQLPTESPGRSAAPGARNANDDSDDDDGSPRIGEQPRAPLPLPTTRA